MLIALCRSANVAAPNNDTNRSHKKPRLGAAAAVLQNLDATVASMPQALASAFNSGTPTSRRHALQGIRTQDWMLPQEKVAISAQFCKNDALCIQYTAWEDDPDLCKMWLQSLLSDLDTRPSTPIPAPSF